MSDYLLLLSRHSRCPLCHELAHLLARGDATGPMFFICFKDQAVFQVGKGQIELEDPCATSSPSPS